MIKRCSIAAFAVPWFALVQSASAAEETQRRAYEEVIVTAQRTEESIQDVPIAVTAFTGGMLEEKQIITPSDLQMNMPNVSFTATNFGGSNFSIRGIGNLVIGASEGGVSIHQSEIAMGTNLVATEFYDMERVEVLRGPQGTLYGKQATGGVINFVSAKPDLDGVSGHFDVEFGDYGHQRVKGALNLPVSETLGLRFAGMRLERDGYIDNTAVGQVGAEGTRGEGTTLSGIDSDIDGRDLMSYRIIGRWEPTEQLSAWVEYNEFREDDDRARITNQVCKRNSIPTIGCEPNGFGFDQPHLGATTGGVFAGLVGASTLGEPVGTRAFPVTGGDFRDMHTDLDPVYNYNERNWLANVSYDFDQFSVSLQGGTQEWFYFSQQDYLMDVGADLGVTALNPTGYWPTSDTSGPVGAGWTDRRCNWNDSTAGIFGGCVHPSDTTRVFAFDQSDGEQEYWTTEIKVQTNFDGAVNFLVGANVSQTDAHGGNYYVNANTLDLVGSYGVPLLGFPQLYPTMFDNTGNPAGSAKLDSTSYFGEIYFQVSDAVKITAGLRYNKDERETSTTSVLYNSFNLCPFQLDDGGTPDDPSDDVPFGAIIPDCADDGFAWMQSALSPLLDPVAYLSPPDAAWNSGQHLAEYYGIYDTYTGFMDAFIDSGFTNPLPYFAAVNSLYGVPPVAQFNETRDLTGSPTKVDFDETTGRFGIDWQWSDSNMVYAFFTRGYKPGGFNPAVPPAFQASTSFSFDSETIDAFEIGSKNVLFNDQLVLNASVFYYDYQGLQISRIANNTSVNDNIDAVIFGVELEGLWRPEAVPGLTIDYAYGYLKAEADGASSIDPTDRTGGNPDWITLKNIDPGSLTGQSFVAVRDQITQAHIDEAYSVCRALSADNPANGTGCPFVAPGTTYADGLPAYFSAQYLQGIADCDPGVGFVSCNTVGLVDVNTNGLPTDLDGNQLPSSPEHKIRIGIAYDFQLAMGILTPRLDYFWQDDMYGREFNTPGDKIEAWDQMNASLAFVTNDGAWQATVWARNLQDEDNVTGHYLTSDTSGFFRNYFLTEPRIWGASVRYNFGAK